MPSNTDLRPNQYALVAGTITWSRIASQVDGEELAQIQRQRAEQGRPTPQRPYTSLVLVDPQIVQADRNQPLTIEEQYLKQNRFYQAKNGRNAGHICFSPTNNGRYLPALYRKGDAAKGEDPHQFYQVFTDKEIASGTKVLVLMRSFAGQMGHNGISMNAVLVLDDHINYYGADNADSQALRKWGLVVNNGGSDEVTPEKAAEIASNTEHVSMDAPVPIAATGVPTQDDVDDTTFDPAITQGISIDSLFGDE